MNLSDAGSMLSIKQEEWTDRLQVGEVLTSGSGSVKEVANKHHHLEKVSIIGHLVIHLFYASLIVISICCSL